MLQPEVVLDVLEMNLDLLTEIDELFRSSSCSHGGHCARTESEHLRRWCSHRSSDANKYDSRIEDDAP